MLRVKKINIIKGGNKNAKLNRDEFISALKEMSILEIKRISRRYEGGIWC